MGSGRIGYTQIDPVGHFENQIVLLDRLLPKKLSWPKIKNCPFRSIFAEKIVLAKNQKFSCRLTFSEVQKKTLNSLKMEKITTTLD